jgi:hypothetical protein
MNTNFVTLRARLADSRKMQARIAAGARGGLLAVLAAFFILPQTAPAAGNVLKVTSVPESLVEAWGLDPFYKKHVSANGFPVMSSEKVSDFALLEAAYLINQMLYGRDDIRDAMIENKVRFVVMACNEFTTAVPEHSTLKPANFWDKRARGLGASRTRPVVSCGEENLLGYPGDPYFEENILIHEFAHAVHHMGMRTVEPTFDKRLRQAYEAAMEAGLWKGTYAAVNHSEYFAEGVQSWFDCNRENDAQHNHVSTRELVKEYDPPLAALIEEVFGDRPWRYTLPAERPAAERKHIEGFDIARAPAFSWPEELLKWNQEYALQTRVPDDELVVLPLLEPDPDPISQPVSTLRDSSILFINQRSTDLSLYRLGPKGERTHSGTLAGGERQRFATIAGQTWLIIEAGGNRLGTVVSSFQPGKAVIE